MKDMDIVDKLVEGFWEGDKDGITYTRATINKTVFDVLSDMDMSYMDMLRVSTVISVYLEDMCPLTKELWVYIIVDAVYKLGHVSIKDIVRPDYRISDNPITRNTLSVLNSDKDKSTKAAVLCNTEIGEGLSSMEVYTVIELCESDRPVLHRDVSANVQYIADLQESLRKYIK